MGLMIWHDFGFRSGRTHDFATYLVISNTLTLAGGPLRVRGRGYGHIKPPYPYGWEGGEGGGPPIRALMVEQI